MGKVWGLWCCGAVLALAGLLAGCAPGPIDRAQAAEEEIVLPSGPDVGAAVLAAVENARLAIGRRDGISAGNDLDAARRYAVRLLAQSSSLFAAAPSDARAGQITGFVVISRLSAAGGAIDAGDFDTADAQLQSIEDGAARRFLPRGFALLRAREGLELAAAARAGERPSEMATQLLTARTAVAGDPETARDAARQALLKAIDDAMHTPYGRGDAVSATDLRNLSGHTADMIGGDLASL